MSIRNNYTVHFINTVLLVGRRYRSHVDIPFPVPTVHSELPMRKEASEDGREEQRKGSRARTTGRRGGRKEI